MKQLLSQLNSSITTKMFFNTLTFRLPPEVFIRKMKISLLHPVLGTVSSGCAKKTVVRMTEFAAALLAEGMLIRYACLAYKNKLLYTKYLSLPSATQRVVNNYIDPSAGLLVDSS